MLTRRSFLGALAGLPVLGHVMQRAPLPTDTPIVTFTDWEQTLPANSVTTTGTFDGRWEFMPVPGTLTTTADLSNMTFTPVSPYKWAIAETNGGRFVGYSVLLDK